MLFKHRTKCHNKNVKSSFWSNVDKTCPLAGHPDPYWQRDHYQNLDGEWDFVITHSEALPQEYPEKILVPFAPETEASGIRRSVTAKDRLHYRKEVDVPPEFVGKPALLRFMAVDQEAEVYVNGELFGTHQGGYLPFTIYIDKIQSHFVLEVVVKDDTASPIYARGKQSNHPKGIWYTPTSGIWQEVYLEYLPSVNFIDHAKIFGDYDQHIFFVDAQFAGDSSGASVEVYDNETLVGKANFDEHGHAEVKLQDSDFHPWSHEDPHLYSLILKDHGDVVRSQNAFRKLESVKDNGSRFLFINHEPCFLSAPLDQGYWPESGLTPPSIEAMEFDLHYLLSCGFNAVRKHIKIEPRRWYALCDRLGIYVMQDIVNGGAPYRPFLIAVAPVLSLKVRDHNTKRLGRGDAASRKQFGLELEGTITALSSIPSIVSWTLFNEGWGQFDAVENTKKLRALDSTRFIDATSGWYDKGAGDFVSRHIYFRAIRLKPVIDRILSLSEFGGYSLPLDGHRWSKKNFGYKRFSSQTKWEDAVIALYQKQILPAIKTAHLSVAVFTQLTDVEQETNGLLTYDREVAKMNPERLSQVNRALQDTYCEVAKLHTSAIF